MYQSAEPYVKQGYQVREDYWGGDLGVGEKKAVRQQLFKGNDYWFWMGTEVEQAKVSVHVYDADGKLCEQPDSWEKGHFAAAHLIPSFPMDGGRAVTALMWQWTGDAHAGARIAGRIGGVFALVLGAACAVGVSSEGLLSAWGMGLLLAIALWLLSSGRSRLARLRERLQGLLVADLMERSPAPLPRVMSVADALMGRLADGRRHGAWLVEFQERLGGIVTMADLRSVPEDERLQTPVGQVMRRLEHEHVVGPRTRLESALRRMAYSRLPLLPVVHGGSLVGVLRRERVDRLIRGESAATIASSAT